MSESNKCPTCQKIFSNKYALQKHSLKIIKCIKPEPVHRCPRCQTVFTHKHHLADHLARKKSCKIVKSESTIQEELKLKQAEEKTQQENIILKQEQEKTKRIDKEYKLRQLEMIRNPQIRVDIINYNITNNINICPILVDPNTIQSVVLTRDEVLHILKQPTDADKYREMVLSIFANSRLPEYRGFVVFDKNSNYILRWNNIQEKYELELFTESNKVIHSKTRSYMMYNEMKYTTMAEPYMPRTDFDDWNNIINTRYDNEKVVKDVLFTNFELIESLQSI
jgi:hypothetical protein